MAMHPLAGKPAPESILENIPRLVSLYYALEPDLEDPAQRVAFGTSGHRGSSANGSFNEAHILAVAQAVCEYRAAQGIDGPMFVGIDTHALSEPALVSAVEVFAANGVQAAADDMGVTVEYQAPGTFDMVEMSQIIDAAVASDPDGLVVTIPDPDALGPSIQAAVDAGIPVISMNSPSS